MKHIKSKKVFELINYDNEIVQNLKDICIDLEDDGFSIDFASIENRSNSAFISICKYSPSKDRLLSFECVDVKDVLVRIIDYLQDSMVSLLYISDGMSGYNSFNLDNIGLIPNTYKILVGFTCDEEVSESVLHNVDITEYINDVFYVLKYEGFEIKSKHELEWEYQDRQMKRDELSITYKISTAFRQRGDEYFKLNEVIPSLQHALSYLNEFKNKRITNVSEIEFVSFHQKGKMDIESSWIIIDSDIYNKLDKYSERMVDIVYLKFRLFNETYKII